MNAKKCDRCGTIYELGNTELHIDNGPFLLNLEYDLCPECFKSFKEWIKPPTKKLDVKSDD